MRWWWWWWWWCWCVFDGEGCHLEALERIGKVFFCQTQKSHVACMPLFYFFGDFFYSKFWLQILIFYFYVGSQNLSDFEITHV